MNYKDYLKTLLSIIIGILIGKYTYNIFSDNIILVKLPIKKNKYVYNKKNNYMIFKNG